MVDHAVDECDGEGLSGHARRQPLAQLPEGPHEGALIDGQEHFFLVAEIEKDGAFRHAYPGSQRGHRKSLISQFEKQIFRCVENFNAASGFLMVRARALEVFTNCHHAPSCTGPDGSNVSQSRDVQRKPSEFHPKQTTHSLLGYFIDGVGDSNVTTSGATRLHECPSSEGLHR